jgi:hypothetical protein
MQPSIFQYLSGLQKENKIATFSFKIHSTFPLAIVQADLCMFSVFRLINVSKCVYTNPLRDL